MEFYAVDTLELDLWPWVLKLIPSLKFLAWTVPEIWRGSQNS